MLINILGIVYKRNRKKKDGVSCQIPELIFFSPWYVPDTMLGL